MNRRERVLVQMLLATRATLDAAIDYMAEGDELPVECAHPKDSRQDYSTLDVEEWHCDVCGYHHHEPRE